MQRWGEHSTIYWRAYLALFALLALDLVISLAVGRYFGTSKPAYFLIAIGVLPPIALWILYVPLWAVVSLKPAPTRYIVETYRANLAWLAIAIALTLFAWAKIGTISSVKSAIPMIVPYYADTYLAELDRTLFFTDPWRITHALIGPALTWWIDRLYQFWHFVQYAFFCWMIFTRNPRLQITALLAFTLNWFVMGGLVAAAFSSVGPCFFADFVHRDDFAPLMELVRRDAPFSPRAMGYLLETYRTGDLGSGISAFPSLHVTIAVWEVLVLRQAFGNRYVTALGALWAFVIFVGSVHLGWHYAVDGIAGTAGAIALWSAARAIVGMTTQRAAPQAGTVAPTEMQPTS